MTETRQTRFEEVQRPRQAWIWCIVLVTFGLSFGIFGYAFYQQLYRGEPFGNNPMSDAGLLVTGLLVITLSLALLGLFLFCRMETRLNGDFLRVDYRPLMHRKIPLRNIAGCEATTYRPVARYGGWGIRFAWDGSGWCYNVSGNEGVRLDLANGKHLLIGSQRPQELAAAIRAARGA